MSHQIILRLIILKYHLFRNLFWSGVLAIAPLVQCLAQGELPVDMYTGSPSISIPIWRISDHDISEPIVMSYNANGVKNNSRGSPTVILY